MQVHFLLQAESTLSTTELTLNKNLLFILFYFFEIGSHYIAQAGLELTIFLLLPPECWDCR
jgi:hypothetical protein